MGLQVRCLNWKYQSGLLPESQGAGALPAGSALHAARLCLRFPAARGSTLLACRCRKGLLGDEKPAHFPLENGVLEWKMAQSGASGGAAPGRGA